MIGMRSFPGRAVSKASAPAKRTKGARVIRSIGKYLGLGSLLVCVMAAQQAAGPAKPASNQVVFVCEHGAAKSVIAAAYFNKLAEERGLPQRAIARGTQPDAAYSPATIQGLKADGVPIVKGKPTLLAETDVKEDSRVITLGCKLPASFHPPAKRDEWEGVPSVSENYPAARDTIKKRVKDLVNELSMRKGR